MSSRIRFSTYETCQRRNTGGRRYAAWFPHTWECLWQVLVVELSQDHMNEQWVRSA